MKLDVYGLLTISECRLFHAEAPTCSEKCCLGKDGLEHGLLVDTKARRPRAWSLQLFYKYSARASISGDTFASLAMTLNHTYDSACYGTLHRKPLALCPCWDLTRCVSCTVLATCYTCGPQRARAHCLSIGACVPGHTGGFSSIVSSPRMPWPVLFAGQMYVVVCRRPDPPHPNLTSPHLTSSHLTSPHLLMLLCCVLVQPPVWVWDGKVSGVSVVARGAGTGNRAHVV